MLKWYFESLIVSMCILTPIVGFGIPHLVSYETFSKYNRAAFWERAVCVLIVAGVFSLIPVIRVAAAVFMIKKMYD